MSDYEKKFVIIGNKNIITYKEVFPLIKNNKMWVGATSFNKDILFIAPPNADLSSKPRTAIREVDGVTYYGRLLVWFTNLDHGRRHQSLELMSWQITVDLTKKLLKVRLHIKNTDNYDAIEVPFTDAIPKDYDGVMGVPISFLDKYNPDQFEILGATESEGRGFSNGLWDESSKVSQPLVGGGRVYKRIFIRFKR